MLIIIQLCGKKKTFIAKFSFIYLVENFNYNFDLIYLDRRIFKRHFKKESFVNIYNCPECVCDSYGTERSAGSRLQNDAELTQIFVLKERANK